MSTTGVPSKPCVTALTCEALYSASTFSFMICIACSKLLQHTDRENLSLSSQVHSKERGQCNLFGAPDHTTFCSYHICSCANRFAVQACTASHGRYQPTKGRDTAWYAMQLISKQDPDLHQFVTTCQYKIWAKHSGQMSIPPEGP